MRACDAHPDGRPRDLVTPLVERCWLLPSGGDSAPCLYLGRRKARHFGGFIAVAELASRPFRLVRDYIRLTRERLYTALSASCRGVDSSGAVDPTAI